MEAAAGGFFRPLNLLLFLMQPSARPGRGSGAPNPFLKVQAKTMPTHIPLHLLLPAIAGIYISQTLLTAMTTQALPALLREAGASLQAVGLTALWWLPWGLKFV